MGNSAISGLGYHHMALRASDFEKSFKFYEALGLTVYAAWGEGDRRMALLDIGDGTYLELFAGGKPGAADAGLWLHLCFYADDIDAAYEAALKAGARSVSAPGTVALTAKPQNMTLRNAFVAGPDGEQIEFFKTLSRGE